MLKNKNIVLTGANRGIGNAILEKLAENHANVWCLVRGVNETFIKQIQELMDRYGIWIKIVIVDLGAEESIKDAVRCVNMDKEPIDALVNNAGMNYRGTFLMTDRNVMEKLYAVNYFANIQLIQSFAKKMILRKAGNIINITSVSGFENNVGNFAYASTKAAMNWATQTMSRELAPYNIRVNGIAPGVVNTGINYGNEAMIERCVIPRMNIKREGKVEEIAEGVIFLLSDKSSFISGQIIRIDGGRF